MKITKHSYHSRSRPPVPVATARGCRAFSPPNPAWRLAEDFAREPFEHPKLSLPGFDLIGFCRSAGAVGGDFYEVLPAGEQAVLLVVADVMGKGAPAAQVAVRLRTQLRALAFWAHRPGKLLALVNRLMFDELSGADIFITAQLALADARERRLTVASAGHCPLLLADGAGNVNAFAPEGMPLGILPEQDFTEHIVPLGPSSRTLLYTDGFTEARNPQGEFFGEQRLKYWLGQRVGLKQSAEQLSRNFLSQIHDFQSHAQPQDDQTFLLLAEQANIASLASESSVARPATFASRLPWDFLGPLPQVAVNE